MLDYVSKNDTVEKVVALPKPKNFEYYTKPELIDIVISILMVNRLPISSKT